MGNLQMKYLIRTGLITAALSFAAGYAAAQTDIPATTPKGHQPIQAEILNASPDNFTINVKKLANWGADENAPTFAVYTGSSLPDICGDYASTELAYMKPEKYIRVFDLSHQPGILTAIDEYQCVIIPNIPPQS